MYFIVDVIKLLITKYDADPEKKAFNALNCEDTVKNSANSNNTFNNTDVQNRQEEIIHFLEARYPAPCAPSKHQEYNISGVDR